MPALTKHRQVNSRKKKSRIQVHNSHDEARWYLRIGWDDTSCDFSFCLPQPLQVAVWPSSYIPVLENNSRCLTAFFNRLKNKLHHEVYFPDFTVPILADSKALVGSNLMSLKGCLSFSSVHRKGKGFHNWTFSTVRCWGEQPQGVWSLGVQDSGKSFDTIKSSITATLNQKAHLNWSRTLSKLNLHMNHTLINVVAWIWEKGTLLDFQDGNPNVFYVGRLSPTYMFPACTHARKTLSSASMYSIAPKVLLMQGLPFI